MPDRTRKKAPILTRWEWTTVAGVSMSASTTIVVVVLLVGRMLTDHWPTAGVVAIQMVVLMALVVAAALLASWALCKMVGRRTRGGR